MIDFLNYIRPHTSYDLNLQLLLYVLQSLGAWGGLEHEGFKAARGRRLKATL
jgi:hypothetical protein